MINEAMVESVVRGVLERLERESRHSPPVCTDSPADDAPAGAEAVTSLHQIYRSRYLGESPFEERLIAEFDSRLPFELGRPLVCIYETHQPCDHCGRCQVRGF